MSLIEVVDVHAGYSAGDVLRGVSVDVDAGSVVAILGANGAGKSTLLKTMMGLVPVSSGKIRFDGEDATGWSTAARVGRGIAFAPEGREVFSSLTVDENLCLGYYARHRRTRGIESELDGVYAIFPALRERTGQLAGDLSGGEQQMLALGRALMPKPRCLLVDELSLGLAPVIVREIYERLTAAAAERELALCIVEQNTHMALAVASRAYVVRDGEITLSGTADELRRDERVVVDAYLRTRDTRARADAGNA